MVRAGVAAHVVGRGSARHYNAVELRSRYLVIGLVAVDRIAVLARVGLTGFRSHRHHFGAPFAQAVQRIPYFHFLIKVVDEQSDSLSGKLHSFTILPYGSVKI